MQMSVPPGGVSESECVSVCSIVKCVMYGECLVGMAENAVKWCGEIVG